MGRHTPINRLISRLTRELLRRYYRAGRLTTRIAERRVADRFIPLSEPERKVYEAVEDYIASTWNQATQAERNAIGFVMTIYRRRLASSFFALRRTLEAHREAIATAGEALVQLALEEALDKTGFGDEPDSDDAARLDRQALALEEEGDIERLLGLIGLFENVVGPLQPIFARLPRLISDRVLEGKTRPAAEREAAVAELEAEKARALASGFDIDAEIDDPELSEPDLPTSALAMDDLQAIVGRNELIPPGLEMVPLGEREFAFRQPGMTREVRITTDPAFYEAHADTVELWSPGSPTFPNVSADRSDEGAEAFNHQRLGMLLSRSMHQWRPLAPVRRDSVLDSGFGEVGDDGYCRAF